MTTTTHKSKEAAEADHKAQEHETNHKAGKHVDAHEDEHKASKTDVAQPTVVDTTTSIAVRMTANLAAMHTASPSGTATLQKNLMTDMAALRTLGGF